MGRPRGGEWLEDEIESLRREGLDVVVSLLTADEIAELDLAAESAECCKRDIAFRSFPIADRGVPEPDVFGRFVKELLAELDAGRTVVVHCRAGIGRSALLLACLMTLRGHSVDEAFDLIAKARGCQVPDTPEQRGWVAEFIKTF